MKTTDGEEEAGRRPEEDARRRTPDTSPEKREKARLTGGMKRRPDAGLEKKDVGEDKQLQGFKSL